jgi:dTDP-4-dehydrorhamnose reductase
MFLITGANGQLGKCLYDVLQGQNAYFCSENDLDITDVTAINNFADGKPLTAIINCAAYTNVDIAEEEQDLAYQVNVLGVKNLVELAKLRDIPLIHISTDYVFGDFFAKSLIGERQATSPQSVYAKTKLEGEELIKQELSKYIIIRTSWLYSQYGKNFLKTILKLASERKEIKVVEDQIGTPTYAMDLAAVIIKMLEVAKNDNKKVAQIYHFSNEGVCSWYDFATEIVKQSESNCKVLPIKSQDFPTKAKRPFFSVLDKSKIKKDLDIEISHWTIGVEKCLKKQF